MGGDGAEDGGGGGADGGSLGAAFDGGGGGALGGAELTGGGGGGGGAAGAVPDGFLVETEGGGGGGLEEPGTGGGGGARGGGASGADLLDIAEIVDDGRDAGRGGGFRRLATNGFTAGPSPPGGTGGGRAPGGLGAPVDGFSGAPVVGGFGREASESERYDASRAAPVSTPPPRLRSFGMPPEKRPPSCGAAETTASPPPPPPLVLGPPSLLLLNRFAEGTGGAKPPGGLGRPGTGGAAQIAGPPLDLFPPPTIGADRSFVTAFFSRGVPLLISASRALCPECQCQHFQIDERARRRTRPVMEENILGPG